MTNNYLLVAVSLLLTSNLFPSIFFISTTNTAQEYSLMICLDLNDEKYQQLPLQKVSDHAKKLVCAISSRYAAGDIIFYRPSLSTNEIHSRYRDSLQELYYLLKIDETLEIEDFNSGIARLNYAQQIEYHCSQLTDVIKIDITGMGAAAWLHSLESIAQKLSNEDRYSPADAMFFKQHVDRLRCYLIESIDHCVNTLEKLKSVQTLTQYTECYNALKLLQAALCSNDAQRLQEWMTDEYNLSLLVLDYTMLVVLDQVLHTQRNVSLILNDAQTACFERLLRGTNNIRQVR